jgi:hypothetical protein
LEDLDAVRRLILKLMWWSVNWINVAEVRVKWPAVLNTAMNVYFHEVWEIP